MSGATVTADHAQTSDRTAGSARRILAVAPVDHPGGAETGLLRLLARLGARGWLVTVTTPGHGPLRETALRAGIAGSRWRSVACGRAAAPERSAAGHGRDAWPAGPT